MHRSLLIALLCRCIAHCACCSLGPIPLPHFVCRDNLLFRCSTWSHAPFGVRLWSHCALVLLHLLRNPLGNATQCCPVEPIVLTDSPFGSFQHVFYVFCHVSSDFQTASICEWNRSSCEFCVGTPREARWSMLHNEVWKGLGQVLRPSPIPHYSICLLSHQPDSCIQHEWALLVSGLMKTANELQSTIIIVHIINIVHTT